MCERKATDIDSHKRLHNDFQAVEIKTFYCAMSVKQPRCQNISEECVLMKCKGGIKRIECLFQKQMDS